MRDLTLTLVQSTLEWQEPDANRDRYEALLHDHDQATSLVLLPEMFTTGFTMDAAEHAETMDGPSVLWMSQLARRIGATVCGSLIIEDDGKYFNRLIWMPPDGNVNFYDKRHLFRMANEQHHYAAGRSRSVFNIGDWRICPLVCYDLRFPVWSRSVGDYDLLLYVANWPAARRSAWRTLLPARAIENLCYVAGVNRIGQDGNDRSYAGDSVVVDYIGQELVNCESRDEVATTTLSGERLRRYRRKFPAHLDADDFRLVDTSS